MISTFDVPQSYSAKLKEKLENPGTAELKRTI